MKHKELKELKKLLEKDKVSDKNLKKVFELLEKLSKSNKSDFKEAVEFCSKLSKKMKSGKNEDKKVFKKIQEKCEKLSKPLKKEKKVEKKAKEKKQKKTSQALSTQQKRVTKTLMSQTISEKTSLTKKDASLALNSILEIITQSLIKGENVTLIGFGKFSTDLRAERDGFNPFSKEKIKIPKHKVAKFTVGAKLKEAVK